MAKKKAVSTGQDTGMYSRLEEYCIWLNEFYRALVSAGFNESQALAMITEKSAYPEWVDFRIPTQAELEKHIEENEEED